MERVRYGKCPLIEVVLQVNFPTILSIDANEPVEFQEKIRTQYPDYNVQTQEMGQVTVGIGNNNHVVNHSSSTMKLYTFTSTDKLWRIILSRDMLLLSTKGYTQWEEMFERFVELIKFFKEIYVPSSFVRIGLRYIDSFERDKLELTNYNWNQLLKPHVCGSLCYAPEDSMQVVSNTLSADLRFDDVMVKSVSGLGMVDRQNGLPPVEAFLMNCDYYSTGQFSLEDFESVANKLHYRSHIYFRDAITDCLHTAMKPEKMDI